MACVHKFRLCVIETITVIFKRARGFCNRTLWVLIGLHLWERLRNYITTLMEIASGVAIFVSICLFRRVQCNIGHKHNLEALRSHIVLQVLNESRYSVPVFESDTSLDEPLSDTSNMFHPIYDDPRFMKDFLIVCTLLAPLPFFLFHSARLVSERRSGLKELLKFVGVSPCMWMTSHSVYSVIIATIYTILITLLLKVSTHPVIMHTNGFIIAITIFLHFQVISCLAFVTSTLSQDYDHADSLALVIYLVTFLLDKFWFERGIRQAVYFLACVLPHTPIYMFWAEVILHERIGVGAQFDNIFRKLTESCESMPIFSMWVFFCVQFILYYFIGWYLDKVRPGRIGVPQKWNFLFKSSFWLKKKKVTFHVTVERTVKILRDDRYFEKGPKAEIAIKITNVSKVFHKRSRPSIQALDSIFMDVYKGEISMVLGVNGAGKTTLLSIVTGMYSATSGSVYINGFDNSSRMQDVKKDLGFCPQYNLTFDHLTVKENITLFEMLRGYEGKVSVEADHLIEELNLSEKANLYSYQLPNGHKRALQVACALAGDPEVVVLDEPSTGMDYDTRHRLWDLLLKLRGSKTFLISTTDMEEADTIGDRISVLNANKLRCYGTPKFLKEAMGSDFKVTLTLKRRNKLNSIIELVESKIPGSTHTQYTDRKVTFTLPSKEHEQFPKLFDNLEAMKLEYGINVIDVGYCMDEIFLGFIDKDKELEPTLIDYSEFKQDHKMIKKRKILGQQVRALLLWNFNYFTWKKWSFLLMNVITPIAFILMISFAVNNVAERIQCKLPSHNDHKRVSREIQDRPAMPLTYNNWFAVPEEYYGKTPKNSSAMGSGTEVETKNVTMKNPKSLAHCISWVLSLVFCISPMMHWVCKFIVHFSLYMLVVPPAILLSGFFDGENTLNQTDFLGALCVMAIFFAPPFLLQAYCISYFMYEGKAISQMYILALSLGILIPVLQGLLKTLSTQEPFLFKVPQVILLCLGHLFPIFIFSCGATSLVIIARLNALCNLNKFQCPNMTVNEYFFSPQVCCSSTSRSPYPYYTILNDSSLCLIILIINCIVFSFVLKGLQNRKIQFYFEKIKNCRTPSAETHYRYSDVEEMNEVTLQHVNLMKKNLQRKKFHTASRWRKNTQVQHHTTDLFLAYNLHKNFFNICSPPREAVKCVSLKVEPGQCLAIVGPCGSGKTALLEALSGFTVFTRGEVYADGYFLNKSRLKFIHNLGFVSSHALRGPNTFATGQSLLTHIGILHGWEKEQAKHLAFCALRYMGLQNLASSHIVTYSEGCMRRLKICILLITSPKTCLLDEPTEGVDIASRPRVYAALHDLVDDKKRVILASQSMEWHETEVLSHLLALIHCGELVAVGTPREVKNSYASGYIVKLKLRMASSLYIIKKTGGLKQRPIDPFGDQLEKIKEQSVAVQKPETDDLIAVEVQAEKNQVDKASTEEQSVAVQEPEADDLIAVEVPTEMNQVDKASTEEQSVVVQEPEADDLIAVEVPTEMNQVDKASTEEQSVAVQEPEADDLIAVEVPTEMNQVDKASTEEQSVAIQEPEADDLSAFEVQAEKNEVDKESAEEKLVAVQEPETDDLIAVEVQTAKNQVDKAVQTENVDTVKTHFDRMFPRSYLVDEHESMLYYHIDDQAHTLLYSEMFKKLEELKNIFPDFVEDYILSETTIEEVFLTLDKDNPYK